MNGSIKGVKHTQQGGRDSRSLSDEGKRQDGFTAQMNKVKGQSDNSKVPPVSSSLQYLLAYKSSILSANESSAEAIALSRASLAATISTNRFGGNGDAAVAAAREKLQHKKLPVFGLKSPRNSVETNEQKTRKNDDEPPSVMVEVAAGARVNPHNSNLNE